MNLQSAQMLFPYLSLGLLISGLFVIRSHIILSFLVAIQTLYAFVNGIIDPIGLFAIAAFWGLCALHWRNFSSKEWFNTIRIVFIAVIAIAFARHMIPGFHNLRLYSGILISPTSMPFTMYLNFDKTMAAVIIAVTSGIFFRQVGSFGRNAWRETFIISALCVSLLIPLAILSGYVQFDPKFPDSFWLWAFNNLCFVCFAEEVIFRGVIQTHLIQLANRWKLSPFIPILISSLLFALALPGHLQGGPLFVGFVTLSGLFYGYAYYKTKRLESAIVVHFIVNLTHFLLFSYPMAAR